MQKQETKSCSWIDVKAKLRGMVLELYECLWFKLLQNLGYTHVFPFNFIVKIKLHVTLFISLFNMIMWSIVEVDSFLIKENPDKNISLYPKTNM